MFDLKTLKTIDEALDMALDTLVEKNAFKKDSPYAQSFFQAQKKVRSEIEKHERNNSKIVFQNRANIRS